MTDNDTASVGMVIGFKVCVIPVIIVAIWATAFDANADNAFNGTNVVVTVDAYSVASVVSVPVVTAIVSMVAIVAITATVSDDASGIPNVTDDVGATCVVASIGAVVPEMCTAVAGGIVVAAVGDVAIIDAFFIATINASIALVGIASTAVDAAVDIALAIALAVVTHVAVRATAFAAAMFDAGIATVAVTSNDGHIILLSCNTWTRSWNDMIWPIYLIWIVIGIQEGLHIGYNCWV